MILTLLLQTIVIVAAARVVGVAFRRLGQPPVIGEMVAGLLLGPSLLGAAAPANSQAENAGAAAPRRSTC